MVLTKTSVPVALAVEATSPRPRSRLRMRLRPGEVVSGAVLAILAVAAISPQVLTAVGPDDIVPADAFRAPSPEHWFGTDQSGRDVFARVVHGARSSLLIGLGATSLGVGLALVFGVLAGLGGRIVDYIIGRFLEVMFAFPSILLGLLFITVFGPGVGSVTIAVGLATAPGYARIVRGQVMAVRGAGYVEAATALGRPPLLRAMRHVVPNVVAPLFVLVTLGLGQTVVWASSLSYLGLGAVPPAAEWGAMLAAGRTYITSAWWLTVFPGALIVLSAVAATTLGRSIQSRTRES